MTQTEIINLFIDDLRISLTEIHELYYGLHYWHNTTYLLQPENRRHFVVLRNYLERYHERVFCYELYHKLRTKMESRNDNHNQNIYSNRHIFLQSELRKDRIHNFIEKIFSVIRLSREFMPDFLLHTPGNFDNQLIVIEVKSNPMISFADIQYDLKKIQEFINNYNYLQGIFIATNVEDERRNTLIIAIREWARLNINTPEKIKLIFKSNPNNAIFEQNISDLN